MKVLFVVGYVNNKFEMNSFIFSQGESLKNENIEIDYLVLKGFSFLKYIKGIFKVNKIILRNKYDLIHAHYGYAGWACSFQKKVPFIISFMGNDLIEIKYDFRKIFNYFINNRIIKKSVLIICKSKELRDYIKIQKVEVIPNGVNFKTFFPIEKLEARDKAKLENDKLYILFPSDPKRREKNFKLAIESYSKIKNDRNELLIVYDKLPSELNYLYNAADVLLLTSVFEGSPNVVKEAMACNLPIVSTDVGDVSSIIDGVAGCFLTTFDSKDVSQKLNEALLYQKRTIGREKIHNLNEEIVAKRIKKIYTEVLNHAN